LSKQNCEKEMLFFCNERVDFDVSEPIDGISGVFGLRYAVCSEAVY